jgi:hypothetical protein
MKKVKHLKLNNPTCTEKRVVEEFERYNRILETQGQSAARHEVLAQMLAAALWIDESGDRHKLYNVFQHWADVMIEPTLNREQRV